MSYPTKQEVIDLLNPAFGIISLDIPEKWAQLAILRKSGITPLLESPDAWPIVYSSVSFDQFPEWEQDKLYDAFYKALCIFAFHQRDNSSAHHPQLAGGKTLGKALALLPLEKYNRDRKVSAILTSTDFTRTVRMVFNAMRMGPKASLDYAQLVWDFYNLQGSYPHDVKSQWARDYYQFLSNSNNSVQNDEGK